MMQNSVLLVEGYLLANLSSKQIKESKLQQYVLHTACRVPIFGVILVHVFPHSDQNNSKYVHFLHSVIADLRQVFCTEDLLLIF